MAAYMNVITVCRRALEGDHAKDTYRWAPHFRKSANRMVVNVMFSLFLFLFFFSCPPVTAAVSSPTDIQGLTPGG